MKDWLYILKSTDTTLDGQAGTPHNALKKAEANPRGEWWLSRRRSMEPGDRIWIYFTAPCKKVAAMATILSEPYEVPGDADFPWGFEAVLDLEATRALNKNPVPLAALVNQHPQGVTTVKDRDLEILLEHAEM